MGFLTYTTASNGVDCIDSIFGDPLFETVKDCYLIASPAKTATWASCAVESGTCSFSGIHEVAYGANGQFFYGSFTNGVPCNDGVFGDPNMEVAKTCYYQ